MAPAEGKTAHVLCLGLVEGRLGQMVGDCIECSRRNFFLISSLFLSTTCSAPLQPQCSVWCQFTFTTGTSHCCIILMIPWQIPAQTDKAILSLYSGQEANRKPILKLCSTSTFMSNADPTQQQYEEALGLVASRRCPTPISVPDLR